jgi:GNAT superfamily N-acetyltransferase
VNLQDIEFRTLNYSNDAEMRTYLRLFWDILLEYNEYFTRRSEAFLADYMQTARKTETPENTYAGMALHRSEIVGLHIVRRFEEWERIGAHIAGLWVHPDFRGRGIARRFKTEGENWARSVGATFMNSNIHVGNHRMLELAGQAGFSPFRVNMRKQL